MTRYFRRRRIMTGNKIKRKVLVQMLSNHLHLELVEVEAQVRQTQHGVEGDLREIEKQARKQMRNNGPFGPWHDEEKDFDVLTILAAILTGLDRGRIVPVQQVEIVIQEGWAVPA